MELQVTTEHRGRVQAFQQRHRTAVLTLLFTDIVGSTRLKQDLGDLRATELVQRHHAMVRELLSQFPEGEEIETAGDSFFLIFVKPSDAAKFSLLLTARLRKWEVETGQRVFDRVGIHIGEVIIERQDDSSIDLFGMQIDTCARINGLAQPGQILMSRFVFDNARQVLKGQDLEGIEPLAWMNHGAYNLKGLEAAVEICEVGEVSLAPLAPPSDSEKASRQSPVGDELVLGWRPALEQAVPHTQWVLQRKLGEGGFGEVWLGRHETLKEQRVFKFCFRADRVRSLKREVVLFRLLKEKVGQHPNIVGVQEVCFDAPPYYIVMDYAAGADLADWCDKQGGVEKVPLPVRMEIIAQTAEALEAAHHAGIIHRDIKPSNILVCESWKGKNDPSTPHPTVRLTDFGIGQVVSEAVLAGVTRMGFTQTVELAGSPRTGTYLYMAPELLAGKKASTRSDIYSLGVVLWQLIIGDFTQPVTTDWGRRVKDRDLREILARCFAGDPLERFASSAELVEAIRGLPQRRESLQRLAAQAAERKESTRRRGSLVLAGGITALLVLLRGWGVDFLEQLELASYDLRVRTAQRADPLVSTNLGFIYIDEESVRTVANGSLGFRFGLYWPRQVYGRLVQELAAQGASAVGLDVIFGESRPDHPPVQMADGSFIDSDAFFARAMRDASNVITGVSGEATLHSLFETNAYAVGDITPDKDSDGVLRRARAFRIYRNWNTAFRALETDPDLGIDLRKAIVQQNQIVLPRNGKDPITIPLDRDGNVAAADIYGARLPKEIPRKARPFIEERVWHMGVVLASRELGLDLAHPDIDLAHNRIVLHGAAGLIRTIPTDQEGRFYIDWCIPMNHPALTRQAIQEVLLQNNLRLHNHTNGLSNFWAGKTVIVGSSDVPGNDMTDRGATPLSPDTLVVSQHWNVANSMKTGVFIYRPSKGSEFALICVAGAIAAGLAGWLRNWRSVLTVTGLTVVYFALGIAVYNRTRISLPLAAPLLCLVTTSLALALWRVGLEIRWARSATLEVL